MLDISLTDIKLYAEISEVVAKILALFLTGAWAIFGLVAFRQRQAATTTLRKAEAEAATLELNSKRRAVLDIVVTHESRQEITDTGYLITLLATISNSGVAPAYLKLCEEEGVGLRIQRARFSTTGDMIFPDKPIVLPIRNASDPGKPARSRVIRAGGVSRLSSVFRVQEPGVYAISFRAPMDENNRQSMIEAGADINRRLYWSATSFAFVGFPTTAQNISKAS
jgi:hypothetical protein